MRRAEVELKPIGEEEYNRLQILAKALIGIGPKLEAMISVPVDSQEDFQHQGVERHPAVLQADAQAISGRIVQAVQKHKYQQPISWEEYEELIVALKTLISEVDPGNEALKV